MNHSSTTLMEQVDLITVLCVPVATVKPRAKSSVSSSATLLLSHSIGNDDIIIALCTHALHVHTVELVYVLQSHLEHAKRFC